MIYLGEQSEALQSFKKIIVCWLMIKLRGKRSSSNPSGYSCSDSTCEICTKNYRAHSNLNNQFRNLFDEVTIRQLVCSKPTDMNSINDNLLQNYQALGYNEGNFKSEAKKLFVDSGYEGVFYKKLNYRLAEWLDKHTCTYCNRQYVFVVRKSKGKKGIVPQFDHWFPKTDYPLLALSFYNLIPSCSICNSSIKSTTNFTLIDHLHPYIDDNISKLFKFNFIARTPQSYEVSLEITDKSNSKILKTLKALETKLLYKGHSNKELQDLINLKYKYSDNYLNILLNETFDGIEISKAEKYRMIFGIEIEEKDYHKRPFSKFKNDIIMQLLAIK